MKEDEIKLLLKEGAYLSIADGQSVINEGDPGDSMFIIKKGRATVLSEILGKTFTLATLSSGGFFGEGGFLTGSPRSATVNAIGALEVLELKKELFQSIIEKNPDVLNRLVQLSNTRAQKTMSKLKGGG